MGLFQSILKRKFPSVDKPLRILAPPKIDPSKRAFEIYKPRGLFSEFYGSLCTAAPFPQQSTRFFFPQLQVISF